MLDSITARSQNSGASSSLSSLCVVLAPSLVVGAVAFVGVGLFPIHDPSAASVTAERPTIGSVELLGEEFRFWRP